MGIKRRQLLAGATGLGALAALHPSLVWAKDSKPIRIGAIFPMSGIGAEAGAAWLQGSRLAVEHWNRNGGVLGRPIELVVRDDKYSSSGAVTAGRELATSGVNLIVGACQSPMALGLAPLLEELNALCVAPTPAAMSLTHENYSRNLFRLCPNAYMLYAGLGRMLAQKHPDIDHWATIVFDSEYGHDAIRYFEYGVRSVSGDREVTFDRPIYTPVQKTDFQVEINQLMNSPAKGLFCGLIAAPIISFLQQGRSIGLDRKFEVMGESGTDLLIAKALKTAMPDNLWSVSYWHPENSFFAKNTLSQQLFKDYVEATDDRYPVGLLTSSHRATQALLSGIEKAGDTDTQTVVEAMEGLTFDTITGPYHIRKEDHQGYGTSVYARVGPKEDEPYYGLNDLEVVNDEQTMEPPSPGEAFTLPA
ncbi:ABC transporter substrate-binding protein [Alloalcanivorax xenomutans]|jgi:branched-chain amino acid transport system substrate-binding protein|uniref:ABC transporter substrate-binding protein n=2 Tax=Pseudomonadota TaxID=1224 RepID=A0A9Q3W5L2_9GAMM|nr:ABC transporter substrate-binding protein [Alloalcanivorax xenomutans]MCE7508493.1 ABC transporter substrate-binding protein [Alloalcanivorax xenomutans]MCE7521792.1 ABC transporter substrate-binding protein [Alloalcanivorax xenomutans]WOA29776.1 ABC transporter substrate-binding protein [Alloalcanivorax xenomutans]WOD26734.1 ABC transporter substrate-binding protein [Alloalcanivorax xenomutans]